MFCLLCSAMASPATAATITWSGATNSDWTTATNWVGGVAPVGVDTAVVNSNAPGAVLNVAPISLTVLYVGNTNGQSGALSILTGGTITTSGVARIGHPAGSTGTVTINGAGSSLDLGGQFAVGFSGTGTLTIGALFRSPNSMIQ